MIIRNNFATSNQHPHYDIEQDQKARSITLNPRKEHKYSLIWLHGLGDSAYGFADVFLNPDWSFQPSNCKVLLLTAPERAVTLNGGMMMTSWYDIKDLGGPIKTIEDLYNKYSRKELLESVDIVTKVIDKEVEKLGDSKKVFVGGFSQGCALSLATMIQYPKVLGGVIGLSGMNAMKVDWSQVPELEQKKKMPIFLYHGEADEMIKHTIAKLTYKELTDIGFSNITLQTEEGVGHSLSENEIKKLREYLKELMK